MADIHTMNKPVVALGKDLMSSLLDLPRKAQKHATAFLTKFQTNPRSSGINLERIANAKDEKLYASTSGTGPSSLSRKAATSTFCCTSATMMTPTNGRKRRLSASTRLRGRSSCTIPLPKRRSTRRCVTFPKTKLDGGALLQTRPNRITPYRNPFPSPRKTMPTRITEQLQLLRLQLWRPRRRRNHGRLPNLIPVRFPTLIWH